MYYRSRPGSEQGQEADREPEPEPDPERVRGACLVALGIGGTSAETDRLLRTFRGGPSGELERAAWIGTALRREGARGMEVPLADFESSLVFALSSYPVTVAAKASPAELDEAFARLSVPVPAKFPLGIRHTERRPAAAAHTFERFTRETVVLTVRPVDLQLVSGSRVPSRCHRAGESLLASERYSTLYEEVSKGVSRVAGALAASDD